ncbi:MAG: hypothetical protein IJO63_01590, partial [Bacilli bacterium]|nr:hypothetical protein [Bacilli bacterium]
EKETIKNRYDHSMERGVSKETRKKQQMFRELGLGFVKVKPEFKARDLTQYEERKFSKDAILLSSKSLTDELLNNL